MGIKICPKCGGKVSTSRDVCIHCGFSFSETKKCPDCEEILDINVKECPSCGYIFEDIAKKIEISEENNAVAQTNESVEEANGVEESILENNSQIENTKDSDEQLAKEESAILPEDESPFVCPYCGNNNLMQIGKELYMCCQCRGKILNIGFPPQVENKADATNNTGNESLEALEEICNEEKAETPSNIEIALETENNADATNNTGNESLETSEEICNEEKAETPSNIEIALQTENKAEATNNTGNESLETSEEICNEEKAEAPSDDNNLDSVVIKESVINDNEVEDIPTITPLEDQFSPVIIILIIVLPLIIIGLFILLPILT